jgi:hypothetical protein
VTPDRINEGSDRKPREHAQRERVVVSLWPSEKAKQAGTRCAQIAVECLLERDGVGSLSDTIDRVRSGFGVKRKRVMRCIPG